MPRGKPKNPCPVFLSVQPYETKISKDLELSKYMYPRFKKFSNEHLVGNVKMPYSASGVVRDTHAPCPKGITLMEFFDIHFKEWVITIEHKDKESEHMHFYIHNHKNLERKTITKYIGTFFPQLKRPKGSVGGANLSKFDEIHNNGQYAYIYKESKDLTYVVSSKGLRIDMTYILKQQKIRDDNHLAMKAGQPGQFYMYVMENDIIINSHSLAEAYLDFKKLQNKTFNNFQFIRDVNYVIMQKKPQLVISKLSRLLQKEYDDEL